jgi:hypothetical protein
MRILCFAVAFILTAGCALQPGIAPVAPAAVAVESVAAPAKPADTLQEAKLAGYKIVNNNGKTVYCREQLMTGSHMRKEIICLTKAELEIAREASRRNLEQMQKRVPPPRGT